MLNVTYMARYGTKPSCMDFNYYHVPNTTPNKCHYEAVLLLALYTVTEINVQPYFDSYRVEVWATSCNRTAE